MAYIDELVQQIIDAEVRTSIAKELRQLRVEKKFGLVFERHQPEIIELPTLPVREGSRVVLSTANNGIWRVVQEEQRQWLLTSESTGEQRLARTEDVTVIKRFGEPIYPTLTPIDAIERAPGKPW